MSGERDLDSLLAGLRPELRPGEVVFAALDGPPPPGLDVLASVREPEGPSVVVERAQADAAGLAYDFVAAWIVLRVHSALDAVGLTAAVAGALTEHGISANVIAGLRHDHVLVPAGRAAEALAILARLGHGR